VNGIIKELQKIILVWGVLYLAGCASLGGKASGPFVSSSDNVAIHYSDVGNAETALVLVHGWMCDRSYWQAQVDYFKAKYRVVTIDLAGHGESGLSRENYSIDKFAGDVITVVNQLKLKKIILVGHSMGGPVVIAAAVKLKEKAIGIATVDAFATGFQWPKQSGIAAMVEPFRADFTKQTYSMISGMFLPTTNKSLVDQIASDMASGPEQVGLSAFSGLLEWMATDYQSARKNLDSPLVHINALHKNMPIIKDKVVFVSDVGHFIPQEAPMRFNKALEQAIYLMN